jgi:hypothetical protein
LNRLGDTRAREKRGASGANARINGLPAAKLRRIRRAIGVVGWVSAEEETMLKRMPTAVMAAACLMPAYAAEPVKWGAYIDLEGRLGNKRDVGEANIFLPIAQSSRTLYFANARARLANAGDREGSLGFGVRHVLPNGWNVGGYGFVDHRRTTYDNSYDQTTFGLEAMGPHTDWRANVYTPFGKDRSTLSSSYAASVSGASLYVTPSVQEERVLPGFDIEAGWRLPFFDVEDARQVRAYVAGYRFADGGVKVEGTRLGVEYVLAEFSSTWKGMQLTLGAEVQKDRARGRQGFAALRLRVPLGGAAASGQRLSAQERRMTAPIVRDVDIVTQVHTRQLAPERVTRTADGTSITAMSGDAFTGGNLSSALAAAGPNSLVVLAGTFDINVPTVMQAGQTLMGAGSLDVVTASGQTVTTSLPGATINAAFPGFGAGTRAIVSMANDSRLIGMNLRSTDVAGGGVNYRGINVIGVSNVQILNNTVWQSLGVTLSGSSTALGVENSTNVIVRNNSLSAYHHDSNAAGMVVLDSSVQITNNRLLGQGRDAGTSFGLLLADTTGSSLTVLPGSTGNVLLNGGCDIPIAMPVGKVFMADGSSCP